MQHAPFYSQPQRFINAYFKLHLNGSPRVKDRAAPKQFAPLFRA
jgi:hypothetical protein